MKELRQIAKEVKVSLRDVTNYVHRISNKTNSPSTSSVMDEVVLEYRVTGLRREVEDLQTKMDKLMNEINHLRAQNLIIHNRKYQCMEILRDLTIDIGVNRKVLFVCKLKQNTRTKPSPYEGRKS